MTVTTVVPVGCALRRTWSGAVAPSVTPSPVVGDGVAMMPRPSSSSTDTLTMTVGVSPDATVTVSDSSTVSASSRPDTVTVFAVIQSLAVNDSCAGVTPTLLPSDDDNDTGNVPMGGPLSDTVNVRVWVSGIIRSIGVTTSMIGSRASVGTSMSCPSFGASYVNVRSWTLHAPSA